ncbi:hypothetical protein JVT61DRAFT_3573 [Boletus reticuloceps]|uniref:Transmembrane protein n=1 Tax=Boletus reticuloceps TaxID=495285 RepID=A0A8I2YQT7_9AGAM|nr:hypothetical protein JVT61DRAFT_3573 [Boletus reticuloceps]
MKMILFRSTFVSATTMLQTIALLCIFLSITSVSAVPQFGRPLFHALDEPMPSRLAVPLVADSSHAPSSVTPTPSATATANSTAESTHTSTPTAVAQTSGASVGLGGIPVALVFSAAASAAWLVF